MYEEFVSTIDRIAITTTINIVAITTTDSASNVEQYPLREEFARLAETRLAQNTLD